LRCSLPRRSVPPQWPACEILLPQARALRQRCKTQSAPTSIGRLLNQAALYLGVRGRYFECRDFYELALETELNQCGRSSNLAYTLIEFLGPEPPGLVCARTNLANILGCLGEHEAAREQNQLALESEVMRFGPNDPRLATVRSNLALNLNDLGKHGAALHEMELALKLDLTRFGPD
jgi:hypothetical protein